MAHNVDFGKILKTSSEVKSIFFTVVPRYYIRSATQNSWFILAGRLSASHVVMLIFAVCLRARRVLKKSKHSGTEKKV